MLSIRVVPSRSNKARVSPSELSLNAACRPGAAVSPSAQTSRYCCGAIVVRAGLFAGNCHLAGTAGSSVRYIPPRSTGASPAVVQLDPVVVLALRIGHIPTVGRQHLVDHDGTIAGGQALFDLGEQDDGQAQTPTRTRPLILNDAFTCSSCLNASESSGYSSAKRRPERRLSCDLPEQYLIKIGRDWSNLCRPAP